MIKSIDTIFHGNYHRSRLEARWAVFFNEVGIKYEYEPQGFANENGQCYLPDFFLPDTYLRGWNKQKGVYIEIKPDIFKESEFTASDWFDKPLVLFKGDPSLNVWGNFDSYGGFEAWKDRWDLGMYLWICDSCKASKIEHGENNYDICPECLAENNYCDSVLLKTAAHHSLLKRFEHSDTR